MNEVKTSALLSQLIEDAKEIGGKKNAAVSVEKILVALIDRLMSEENDKDNAELQMAGDIVKERVGDLRTARESLMTHICQKNSSAFLDDLFLRNKLSEAFAIVAMAGDEEVNMVVFAVVITHDTTDAIKAIMKQDDKKDEIESNTDSCDIIGEDAEDDMYDDDGLFYTENETSRIEKSGISETVAKVKRIRTELQNSVFGQDNAINVFVTGYFRACLLSMIEKSAKRPRATFLFAGPPGVGKTFLAEKIAELLKLPFMRFDMSEYVDKEANIEFCGSDKVYRNAKAGNVTDFVAKNPKCVLLFDEIEKANRSVIHLFLQILDAGRLRDNYTDEEVSFADAVIIFTTNAGKQLYEENESGDLSTISRKVVINSLQKDINPETKVPYFPGPICSRFSSGNVVMFNHIGANNLLRIAKREIEKNVENLKREIGIEVQVDEQVYSALLFSEGGSADARTIKSKAESFLNDELYELLRLISSDKADTGIDEIEKICIDIDISNAKAEILELFSSAVKTRALVFASDEMISHCREKNPNIDFVGINDLKTAIDTIKTQDIDFVLLDIRYGASASFSSLNIEDIESPARDFFKFVREQKRELPVYLIEDYEKIINDEERISFTRQGVRDVLRITPEEDFGASKLHDIATSIHQQSSMISLAKANKLISFETAQTVSADGRIAQIKLYDFKKVVAVDAEDSKNILSAISKPNVHFDDVIGAEEAKEELSYFVEYLKNPKKYMGTGVKAPKGVLLYGPPGTGKTMLAKAMACESGVTFIAAEGNQFLKKFVGEGSEKVHEIFKTARKYAPSILFVDEIDAIAKERKGGEYASANGENVLTAFLAEMDGFVSDPSKPVFVLAATNFDVEPGNAKSLDSALMRRFDRRVYIDLPNKEDRIRFLKMKISKNRALDITEAQIDNISVRATGMSLAELDSVVELALRSAIREGSTVVTDSILEEAFETFNNGEVKKWNVSQLERVARHEAGHALLCWLSGETPSYLTIVARGNHGGYMQHAEQEGKAIYTKDELLSRIRIALGGRAAEIAYYGERDGISTGASGDLASATNTARQIVCTYGMDDEFGLAVISGEAVNGTAFNEVMAAINRILKEQMNEAVKLISENTDKIDSLVDKLMLKNHLNGAEIEALLSKE